MSRTAQRRVRRLVQLRPRHARSAPVLCEAATMRAARRSLLSAETTLVLRRAFFFFCERALFAEGRYVASGPKLCTAIRFDSRRATRFPAERFDIAQSRVSGKFGSRGHFLRQKVSIRMFVGYYHVYRRDRIFFDSCSGLGLSDSLSNTFDLVASRRWQRSLKS